MNFEEVIKAYKFAKRAHKGQKRKTGENYITHPKEVASIIENYGGDNESIAAGFLHDVDEDTTFNLKEIKEKFGKTIDYLVDGVTKTDNLVDTIEKIKKYAQYDKRIILIKMADRLHNLKTLKNLEKKERDSLMIKDYFFSTTVYIEIGKRSAYKQLAIDLEKELNKVKMNLSL